MITAGKFTEGMAGATTNMSVIATKTHFLSPPQCPQAVPRPQLV